ncbi:hypothetical protein ES703_23260 [subsurface metagenome]
MTDEEQRQRLWEELEGLFLDCDEPISDSLFDRRVFYTMRRCYLGGRFQVPIRQATDADILCNRNVGSKILARVRDFVPAPE